MPDLRNVQRHSNMQRSARQVGRTPGFAKTVLMWVSADTERMQKSGCRFLKQQKYHSTRRVSSLKMLELTFRVLCNSRTIFYSRKF